MRSDDERLPFADRFAPEIWMGTGDNDRRALSGGRPLIPFSAGPGICPGRNLVLLLTSALLARLVGGRRVGIEDDARLVPCALPGTLDDYSLRFRLDT